MKLNNAMTNKRNILSVKQSSPVDGLLMDRLSVIARNRGMGGRRLGPHTMCVNIRIATSMPYEYMNTETSTIGFNIRMLVPYHKKYVRVKA